MKIKSAEYQISAVSAKQFPDAKLPEVAFAGKSNVGKSTLINSLLNRRGLVKTSSTPGKTRAINFFLINNEFYLNDLPGYGFAKVANAVQQTWAPLIETYLASRTTLKAVVLIIDSRHGPTKQDLEMKAWLDHYEIQAIVVASKIDKLKKNQIATKLKDIQTKLELPEKPLGHSSLQHAGRQPIWQTLQKVLWS